MDYITDYIHFDKGYHEIFPPRDSIQVSLENSSRYSHLLPYLSRSSSSTIHTVSRKSTMFTHNYTKLQVLIKLLIKSNRLSLLLSNNPNIQATKISAINCYEAFELTGRKQLGAYCWSQVIRETWILSGSSSLKI